MHEIHPFSYTPDSLNEKVYIQKKFSKYENANKHKIHFAYIVGFFDSCFNLRKLLYICRTKKSQVNSNNEESV